MLRQWRRRPLDLEGKAPLFGSGMMRRQIIPGIRQRALAALCAGLVFALTLFAASPTAHNWLHSGSFSHSCPGDAKSQPDSSSGDHDCAVVLFANGVESPIGAITLAPQHVVTRAVSRATAAAFYLVSPRYLRQPERGPPLSRVG
jgi:hypothetical protein